MRRETRWPARAPIVCYQGDAVYPAWRRNLAGGRRAEVAGDRAEWPIMRSETTTRHTDMRVFAGWCVSRFGLSAHVAGNLEFFCSEMGKLMELTASRVRLK